MKIHWTSVSQKDSKDHLDDLLAHHLETAVARVKSPSVWPAGDAENMFSHQSKLIHYCSPTFLQVYLPFWKQHGFFSHSTVGKLVETDPSDLMDIPDPELLHMAQRVRLRMMRIMHYLVFIKSVHSESSSKSQSPRSICIPGQRLNPRLSWRRMKNMYADWDDVDDKVRSERRRRFLKENRHARRWLLAASKLSFGVLLVSSNQLESQVNDSRTSDSYLVTFLERMASQYPHALDVFQLLSGTVRSILNFERAIQGSDLDLVVARIRRILEETDNQQDKLSASLELLQEDLTETNEFLAAAGEHCACQEWDGKSPAPEDILAAYSFRSTSSEGM